jgi:hypothetical protein
MAKQGIEQVEGQKLEKQNQQNQQKDEPNDFIWQALLTMLLIIGLGGLHQHFRSKNSQ